MNLAVTSKEKTGRLSGVMDYTVDSAIRCVFSYYFLLDFVNVQKDESDSSEAAFRALVSIVLQFCTSATWLMRQTSDGILSHTKPSL